MKRCIVIGVCIALILGSAFGANEQKIYPVNSDIHEIITSLYLTQGLALPSNAGPYSGSELMEMLKRIEPSTLTPLLKEIYDQVSDELYEEQKVFQLGADVTLEAYIHANTTSFTHEEDWTRGGDERKPLVNIILETFPADSFYGYSEFTLTRSMYKGYNSDTGQPTAPYYGENVVTNNVYLLPLDNPDSMDMGWPYRAFGAFGGTHWSAQFGRDRLSWGAGKTGNLMLSDSLFYHNMGRFTAFNDTFKYTLVASFFPHPNQYYGEKDLDLNDSVDSFLAAKQKKDTPILEGIYMFLAHRLEGRLFNGKVGLAVSESMMYQSKENLLDLRILSPATLYHNYYIRPNSNSLLTLEFDYTPIRYLNIYGQVAIDEFSTATESTPGENPKAFPSALGYLFGAQTAVPVHKGILSASLEFVLTDPFLYLRDGGVKEDPNKTTAQRLGEWGVSYVVALKEYGASVYQEEFLTYPYGPDAIVLNAQVGYKEFNAWNISSNLFYMWHGTHDKWTLWKQVHPVGSSSSDPDVVPYLPTPTEEHHPENNGDKNYKNRDAVTRTFVLGVKGGYTILPGLEAYAQADLIHIVNPKNIRSNPPITDVQLTIGLTYSF